MSTLIPRYGPALNVAEIEPIEITDAMIAAAIYEMKYGDAESPADVARAIYIAMVTEFRMARDQSVVAVPPS